MAALFVKHGALTGRCFVRSLALAPVSSFRASSTHGGPVVDPVKGKVVSDKIDMPDTLGHSVGPERWELLARLAGNEDPFEMNIKKRAKGTQQDPTLIPSMYEKRLIGCVCEEDSISIHWMFLFKGEAKRCHCGNWYKLVELDTSKFGVSAGHGHGHGHAAH